MLKVRRLSSFFDDDAYAFTSTRRNFFPRRHKGFDFQDESMFFSTTSDTTSDLRHFGPKTFRHYVFGAEVSRIFALVPKWH